MTFTLQAQGDCEDGIHTYVTIGTNGIQTTVSAEIAAGNLLPVAQAQTTSQYVKIEGDLYVDIPYYFTGSDIIVYSDASPGNIGMAVFDDLYLSNTTVRGCNYMWNGFSLFNSSKLHISETSKIEDALKVIKVLGSNIEVLFADSEFDANYILLEKQSSNNDMVGSFYGNHFIGDSDLLPPFSSSISRGFNLKDFSFFEIGDTGQLPNTFEGFSGSYDLAPIYFWYQNMNSGNALFSVLNTEFVDCSQGIYADLDWGVDDAISLYDCSFMEVGRGVYSKQVRQFNIENCIFTNLSQYSVSCEADEFKLEYCEFDNTFLNSAPGHASVVVKQTNSIKIKNNEFTNLQQGIRIEDCYGVSGYVSSNAFEDIYTAMELHNVNSNFMQFTIGGNDIKSDMVGVFADNSHGIQVKNNDVKLENVYLGEFLGIGSSIGHNIVIRNNEINGNNQMTDAFTFHSSAMFLRSSTSSDVECNEVKNSRNGFYAEGLCSNTDFVMNSHKNHIYGTNVADGIGVGVGEIGHQYNTGNKWLDINPLNLELIVESKPLSTFLISSEVEPIWPDPHDANVFEGGQPAYDERYCLMDWKVSPPTFSDFDNGGVFKKVIDNTFINLCGGWTGVLHDGEFNTFEALDENRDLIGKVNGAQTFWNLKVNSALGQLYFIEKGIRNLGQNGVGQIQADAQGLLNLLTGIFVNGEWEINMKDVLTMTLHSVIDRRSEWTTAETTLLESIAEQCPYSGGRAVYKARALLKVPFGTYDDADICRRITPRQQQTSVGNAVIYPNPVFDEVTIEIDEDYSEGKVELFDMTGRMLDVVFLSEDQNVAKLSVDDLPDGLFLIRVLIDDSLYHTENIIISKK